MTAGAGARRRQRGAAAGRCISACSAAPRQRLVRNPPPQAEEIRGAWRGPAAVIDRRVGEFQRRGARVGAAEEAQRARWGREDGWRMLLRSGTLEVRVVTGKKCSLGWGEAVPASARSSVPVSWRAREPRGGRPVPGRAGRC